MNAPGPWWDDPAFLEAVEDFNNPPGNGVDLDDALDHRIAAALRMRDIRDRHIRQEARR